MSTRRKEQQKPKESVHEELDEMFNQVPFVDRVKLQLISWQYKMESPMFKMLFDKKYRYDRYQAITQKQRKFKNRSQFKSYVFSNYNDFNLDCIEYLNFLPKTKPKTEEVVEEQKEVGSQEEEKHDNILLLNKILHDHMDVYKIECVSKGFLATLIGYLFLWLPFKILNQKVFCGIVFPGIATTLAAIYQRGIKFKEYEMQVDRLYKDELRRYDDFFREESYDD